MNAEPGYTTTEFWISVLAVVAVLLNPTGIKFTPDMQAAIAGAIVSLYGIYRTWRKNSPGANPPPVPPTPTPPVSLGSVGSGSGA